MMRFASWDIWHRVPFARLAVACVLFVAACRPSGPDVTRIANGTRDNVYSVSGSRMRLLPQLRRAGYDVTYYEFDGPHFVTPSAARAALNWLTS